MMSKKKRKRMYKRLKKNVIRSIKHGYYRLSHLNIKLNISILLVVALVLYLISASTISYVLCWVAAVVFGVLLVLIKLEQHQEMHDYREWQRKNLESFSGHEFNL
jgi:ABC-type siderophore export system fused ATPase/permease subunit